MSVAWEFDAGSAVHALVSDGDNVVACTQDGTGLLLDAHGKELWRIETEGRINADSPEGGRAAAKYELSLDWHRPAPVGRWKLAKKTSSLSGIE